MLWEETDVSLAAIRSVGYHGAGEWWANDPTNPSQEIIFYANKISSTFRGKSQRICANTLQWCQP